MQHFRIARNLLFLAFPVLGLLASCSGTDKADIVLEVKGAPDSTAIVVSRLAVSRADTLDTLYLRNEKVKYTVDVMPDSPEFVYMGIGGRVTVPLLVKAGERVRVSSDWKNPGQVSVDGSEESSLLQTVDAEMKAFNVKFDSLFSQLENADAQMTARLSRELGRLYVKRKQDASKYILTHQGSLTVVPLLYQETPNGIRIFSDLTDAILMEQVYDSLHVKYPSSPYLAALADDMQARRNAMEMGNILSQAEEVDYPEIELADTEGVQRSLSALAGKVIVLVFWNDSSVEQRAFNVGLKELYGSCHADGLEIYQVSLNADKTAWAMQVKQQELPWISVSDPSGQSALLYNVKELPAMYVISREGVITARNVFNIDLLRQEVLSLL